MILFLQTTPVQGNLMPFALRGEILIAQVQVQAVPPRADTPTQEAALRTPHRYPAPTVLHRLSAANPPLGEAILIARGMAMRA
jgi:hypothetical protein